MDLFEASTSTLNNLPLTETLRPQKTEDILGQKNILKWVQRWKQTSRLPSLILWGPPGTGKTSFANCLIQELGLYSESVNAIDIGSKKLKELGQQAHDRKIQFGRQTVVFVDEIHRLTKSQQDVLLPYVEKADFILIGATTENPSYRLNKALLSRCQLVVFELLSEAALEKILIQAFHHYKKQISEVLTEPAVGVLLKKNFGDARRLLSDLEIIFQENQVNPEAFPWGPDQISEHFQKAQPFDRADDDHYDTISAFIKSLRGSDPDAALYYLARMLAGGEDPLFIVRRMIIFASEDIGNADPRALTMAVSCLQAVEFVGLPEAAINLSHVVTYLASAPKSNRSYMAWNKAQSFVESHGPQAVPLHLRSSKTAAMKELGYGKGYKYPHDYPKNYVQQDYFPENVKPQSFYEPSERGFEKNIKEYLDWIKR